MNIIDLLLNISDISSFLGVEDIQKIILTNRYANDNYSKFIFPIVTCERFGIHYKPDSLEKIYFGYKPSNENIKRFKSVDLTFEIHHHQEFKKINDYYCWWDKYLSFFFNYQRYSNYFIYEFNNQYNFIKDILYFEIELLEDIPNAKCFSIGFAPYSIFLDLVDIQYLLGWYEQTIGFHSDDGCIYKNGDKQAFFEIPRKGDIISCGYNFYKKEVFFILSNNKKTKKYIIDSFYISNMVYPCTIYDIDPSHIRMNYCDPFINDLKIMI